MFVVLQRMRLYWNNNKSRLFNKKLDEVFTVHSWRFKYEKVQLIKMGNLSSRCWRPPVKGVIVDCDFIMATGKLHLEPIIWLQNLELKEYGPIFGRYDGVEDFLGISERNLKDLGIKNGSHRARMISSLVILKQKYEKGNRVQTLKQNPFSNSPRRSRTTNDLFNGSSPVTPQRPISSPALRFNQLSLGRENSGSRTSHTNSKTMEPMTDGEASSEELKKALEWELSLDNSDLRSHAWYHGTIPRQRAEELMSDEGDFLIRDCISRPGDYVLTCRWRGSSLHFVINKVVFQPFTVYERIQYQFEDDCFDTVPDLVTFYVGNKRPISAASGAVVSHPVNRSMPLTYYASRYSLECQMHYATLALEKDANSHQDDVQGKTEELSNKRLSQVPEVPPKTSESGSLSAESLPSGTLPLKHSVHSNIVGLTTIRSHHHHHSTIPRAAVSRVGSDPMLSPSLERRHVDSRLNSSSANIGNSSDIEQSEDRPPPKPSRVPSKKYAQTHGTTKLVSGVYSNENAGSHLYSEPVYQEKESVHSNNVIDGSTFHHTGPDTGRLKEVLADAEKSLQGIGRSSLLYGHTTYIRDTEEKLKPVIELNVPPTFDLQSFTTVLLPPENKPLDSTALARGRCMLMEYGPRLLAGHLTRADLDVLKIKGDHDLGLGVVTGLELLLLPQGHQLRLDLLERTECLKFFVAITILTCGEENNRADLLNKWIQVAIETKTALGNLYGFAGIMQGLSLPQITRLKSTWLTVRQTYTDNAFTYETKLRPTLKAMQECSNPQAPNTCIPYLLSIITILQRHLEAVQVNEKNGEEIEPIIDSKGRGKVVTLGLQWEQTSADYGLQLLLTHLDIGRSLVQQWPTYRRNSEIVLENVKYDDIMLDMFRTEFHLKFLWGCKGANVSSKERYSKFDQVLSVMSERCEAS